MLKMNLKQIKINFVKIQFTCKDFFGRVKNKAGDMEKILKEKDKHGLFLSIFLKFLIKTGTFRSTNLPFSFFVHVFRYN